MLTPRWQGQRQIHRLQRSVDSFGISD